MQREAPNQNSCFSIKELLPIVIGRDHNGDS